MQTTQKAHSMTQRRHLLRHSLALAVAAALPPLPAPKVDEAGNKIHPKDRGRAKKRLQSLRAMKAMRTWKAGS